MSEPTSGGAPSAPGLAEIELREMGGKKDGERQALDRRIFFQLFVFDVAQGATKATRDSLASAFREKRVPFVLYQDATSPTAIGILVWSEDPAHFVDVVLPLLDRAELIQRREYTMLGRTYAIGHEPDLEHAILHRSIEYVQKPGYDWHVWYPLRRHGSFEMLDGHTQSTILREHASIGMAYGRGGHAHDVRLACHGLDANDNEFVIGLVGKELHPLSHIVQTMRHTKQTSEYIAKMGPFFVGRVMARGGAE